MNAVRRSFGVARRSGVLGRAARASRAGVLGQGWLHWGQLLTNGAQSYAVGVTGADHETGLSPGTLSTESVAERRERLGANQGPMRRRGRWAAVVFAAIFAFALAVVFVGIPGPEPVRRYPAGDLMDLVSRINERSHEARPNDPCRPDVVSDPASIDWLRGRIVIDDIGFDAATLSEDERAMVGSTIYARVSCELG